LLLRRPERSRDSRRDDPAKRPSSLHEQGAQRSRDGGELTDLGKVRKTLQWGGMKKHVAPLQKRTQPKR
jgi:hypothetical protein